MTRNAVGFGLFGGAIYGLITLLPLFYQTLMGYTAQAAGIAVSPRGIGAILAMPFIALLTGRMDNRYIIAAGHHVHARGCHDRNPRIHEPGARGAEGPTEPAPCLRPTDMSIESSDT